MRGAHALLAGLAAHAICPLEGPIRAQPPTPEQIEEVQAFVSADHPHGVPYAKAIEFSPSLVGELANVLDDDTRRDDWPRVLAVLGAMGEEKGYGVLADFLATRPVTLEDYPAHAAALLGLGYFVHSKWGAGGSFQMTPEATRALEDLRTRTNPGTWTAQPSLIDPALAAAVRTGLADELSREAVLGLTLSGHPAAFSGIEASLGRVPPARQAWVFIRDHGLLVYYQNPSAAH
jgi:hypothetical protein